MDKSVRNKLFMSITSIICVVAVCIIANSAIPSLYESHAQKVAAQEAATRTTKQVVTVAPTTTQAAPETTVTEESVVYEIEETTEAVVEESSTEAVTEETTTEAEEAPAEEGILDKVLNFLTSIFEMIFSGEIFTKLGDAFADILGMIGL